MLQSGSSKIQDVISWGNNQKSGLNLMHAHLMPESLSGFSSAGCQLVLFSTGVGNSFNNHIAPSIKFSANPEACKKLSEQLDFKCSDVFMKKYLRKFIKKVVEIN